MAPESTHPAPFHPPLATILDQLACPACLFDLQLEKTALTCSGCGRVYPILDGIPVLIAESGNEGLR